MITVQPEALELGVGQRQAGGRAKSGATANTLNIFGATVSVLPDDVHPLLHQHITGQLHMEHLQLHGRIPVQLQFCYVACQYTWQSKPLPIGRKTSKPAAKTPHSRIFGSGMKACFCNSAARKAAAQKGALKSDYQRNGIREKAALTSSPGMRCTQSWGSFQPLQSSQGPLTYLPTRLVEHCTCHTVFADRRACVMVCR